MVILDEEYSIGANENCYTLDRKIIVQDKDSKNYGKETTVIEGYYTTIDSAILGYIKLKTRQYINKNTKNTLNELLEEVNRLSDYIKEKFGKV